VGLGNQTPAVPGPWFMRRPLSLRLTGLQLGASNRAECDEITADSLSAGLPAPLLSNISSNSPRSSISPAVGSHHCIHSWGHVIPTREVAQAIGTWPTSYQHYREFIYPKNSIEFKFKISTTRNKIYVSSAERNRRNQPLVLRHINGSFTPYARRVPHISLCLTL
jgi:hypothetical protein